MNYKLITNELKVNYKIMNGNPFINYVIMFNVDVYDIHWFITFLS
jgi:hypothetical protein